MCSEITEEYLQTLTTPNSFEKALDLFYTDAVFDTFAKGDSLEGKCEGRGQPYYQVEVELENGLVSSAYCTCPYDWGGYCKHIIALLLTYTDDPTAFVIEVDLDSFLIDVDRETLVNIVKQMASHDKAIYGLLQKLIQKPPTQLSMKESDQKITKLHYKERIQSIFNPIIRSRMSETYWLMPEIVDELSEILDAANNYYEAGDVQTALDILTTSLAEVADQYDQLDDSDGLLGYFFYELAFFITEVLLSIDVSEALRSELYKELKVPIENLVSCGIDDLDVILLVLSKDWKDESVVALNPDGVVRDIITTAKLNVLESQNCLDEYLSYSLKVGAYTRHILMQIKLGETEKAVQIAWDLLSNPDDVLKVVKALKEAGHLEDAIRLGEKGLQMDGNHYVLGIWLAPLEEAQGRIDQAIAAYKAAFDSAPTLEIYLALKQLARENWEEIRHDLITTMKNRNKNGLLLDVYLSEGLWDPAISIADEAGHWDYHLIDKVTKAVLPFRPEWVIKASQVQAERLILKASRKHYQIAVHWLEKVKKAYQEIDQQSAWVSFFERLKNTYPRRHALLDELKVLE